MPRTSESELQMLEIVAENKVAVYRRLRPPTELSGEQREEFVQVVSSVPADNLAPANIGLLCQYVRHRVMARRVSECLEVALRDGQTANIELLARAQIRESKI